MDDQELRARRRALGLSQAALAARINLSRDYIGQMERGVAEVLPRTAAAVLALRPPSDRTPKMKDPMERILEEALIAAGLRFTADHETEHKLDFQLLDYDVAIEVKRFHSPRIADQMARASNVIVAQGEAAVRFLAAAIRGGDFLSMTGQVI